MKRIVTTLFMACCMIISVKALNGTDQAVDFRVEKAEVDTPIYRAPAMVPVQGYYVSLMNTLYLSFAYDMGNVTVTIENTEAGEFLSETIPTDSGFAIPLGAENGLYTITIVRGGGQQYSAELLL